MNLSTPLKEHPHRFGWIQLGLALTQNPAIPPRAKVDFQLREPKLQPLSHPGCVMEIHDRKPGGFSYWRKNSKQEPLIQSQAVNPVKYLLSLSRKKTTRQQVSTINVGVKIDSVNSHSVIR